LRNLLRGFWVDIAHAAGAVNSHRSNVKSCATFARLFRGEVVRCQILPGNLGSRFFG
jgi:hypothetical protein